jgi:drug/metabolite transporter (DMT)-like permease
MSTPTPSAIDGGSHVRGILLMCSAGFCFAVMDAGVKHLTVDYPVPQVIWARYAFHFLLMLVFLGPRYGTSLLYTRRLGTQLGRSLLLFGATVNMFFALKYIPLAEAATIGFANPLVVTALSVPILSERVGGRRWAAVVVGFLGVIIVLRPGIGVMHWAAVLPLGMAFCYAIYQILTRLLAGKDNPRTILFYTALVGTVITSVAMPFVWVAPTAEAWGLMVAIGAIAGIGHYALIKAFEITPASVLAPFGYIALIWVILAGYIAFGDLPDQWTVGGAVVIVGSGLYIVHRERQQRRIG